MHPLSGFSQAPVVVAPGAAWPVSVCLVSLNYKHPRVTIWHHGRGSLCANRRIDHLAGYEANPNSKRIVLTLTLTLTLTLITGSTRLLGLKAKLLMGMGMGWFKFDLDVDLIIATISINATGHWDTPSKTRRSSNGSSKPHHDGASDLCMPHTPPPCITRPSPIMMAHLIYAPLSLTYTQHPQLWLTTDVACAIECTLQTWRSQACSTSAG